MNHEDFQKVFEDVVKRCEDVLVQKSKEYSSEDDKLHNFKIAAGFTQSTPEQALWGFLVKHLVSISDLILTDTRASTDTWDEKIGDSINYLILLRALIDDRPDRGKRFSPASTIDNGS